MATKCIDVNSKMAERDLADEREAWWAAVKRSTELVRGMPAWTQAGIVLSENFTGPHATSKEKT